MDNQNQTTSTVQQQVLENGGWFLPRKMVNHIVEDSLNNLIARAKGSHMCDVILRENGKDVGFQADWVKYMVPTTIDPTQPLVSTMLSREMIFKAMEQSGFTRTSSCCDITLGKMCSGDEYKGNLEAFVGALLRLMLEHSNKQPPVTTSPNSI